MCFIQHTHRYNGCRSINLQIKGCYFLQFTRRCEEKQLEIKTTAVD